MRMLPIAEVGESVRLPVLRGSFRLCVLRMSRNPRRIVLAVSIDMPQKSGTRCAQWPWQVMLHSEHLRAFFLPNGSM
jgi:hypothetical protein